MNDFGEIPQSSVSEYRISGETYDTRDPHRPTIKLMQDPMPSMENSAVNTAKLVISANDLKDNRIYFGRQPQEKPGINVDPSIINTDMETNDYVSRLHGELVFQPDARNGRWIWTDRSSNGTEVFEPEVLQYEHDKLEYRKVAQLVKNTSPLSRVFQGTVLKLGSDVPDKENSSVYLRFHLPNFETDEHKIPTRTTDENILVVERIAGLDAPMTPELETLVRRYSPQVVEPPQNF